jgi:hypothetical protein
MENAKSASLKDMTYSTLISFIFIIVFSALKDAINLQRSFGD